VKADVSRRRRFRALAARSGGPRRAAAWPLRKRSTDARMSWGGVSCIKTTSGSMRAEVTVRPCGKGGGEAEIRSQAEPDAWPHDQHRHDGAFAPGAVE